MQARPKAYIVMGAAVLLGGILGMFKRGRFARQ
jgi:hypothetical protein